MNSMFQCCYELENLELNFNTENVTDMSLMFNQCNKLKYLNINSFKLKNGCTFDNMFDNIPKKYCKFVCNDKKILNLYKNNK